MEAYIRNMVSEMEETGIMINKKVTAAERLSDLLDYETLVCKMVYGEQISEKKRLSDVVDYFQIEASRRGLSNNPVIVQASEDMSMIGKAIAISLSGASGEKQVKKQLQYVRRNMISIPNLCIEYGGEKTELDQVVVTSNGVIILEVKNYKHDITISEAGLIYGPDHKIYSDKVLGEQMNAKRYLLSKRLTEELGKRGIINDVYIATFVVFSNPNMKVTDLYGREPYCYKAKIPYEIDQFCSHSFYSQEQMNLIAESLMTISDSDNRFEVEMDFDRIRRTFAEALYYIKYGQPNTTKHEAMSLGMAKVPMKVQPKVKNTGRACRCVATSVVVSSLCVGLLLALKRKL